MTVSFLFHHIHMWLLQKIQCKRTQTCIHGVIFYTRPIPWELHSRFITKKLFYLKLWLWKCHNLFGSPFIVSPHPLNDVNFKVLKSISLAFQHTIFNWLHLYRRRTGSQELSKWYLMCPDKVKRQKSYTKHALFPAMNCSLKLRKWICKFIVKLF